MICNILMRLQFFLCKFKTLTRTYFNVVPGGSPPSTRLGMPLKVTHTFVTSPLLFGPLI